MRIAVLLTLCCVFAGCSHKSYYVDHSGSYRKHRPHAHRSAAHKPANVRVNEHTTNVNVTHVDYSVDRHERPGRHVVVEKKPKKVKAKKVKTKKVKTKKEKVKKH